MGGTEAAQNPIPLMLHTFGHRGNRVLLLLHGIGAGHRLWRRQIERFQSTHFVVAPDLPALTGPATGAPADIVEIATRLERALRQQSIDRFSVCGISAGASVALALAPRMSGGIDHLILSAPQVRAPRPALGLQIALCQAMPERMLLRTVAQLYRGDREIAEVARADCEALGKSGLLRAMRALWKLDLRPELPRITAPTFVFCGSRDRANIPAARAVAATIPGASLRIEPGVGHLWNVDAAAQFNDAVASVLADVN